MNKGDNNRYREEVCGFFILIFGLGVVEVFENCYILCFVVFYVIVC